VAHAVQHIDGTDPDRWEGIRVQYVAVMPDKSVLAADTHRRIRSYKFEEQLDFDMSVPPHNAMFCCVYSLLDTNLLLRRVSSRRRNESVLT